MNENSVLSLEEIKRKISTVQEKVLDSHSKEFEEIHSDLNRVLSEIDGL
jgi:hypothetical protein